MVACSFLPAATQMIYDMNLQHLLKGVTFECMQQARSENEIIVRCLLEGNNYSSEEIDKIFSASKTQGKSLYYVEDIKLQSLAPDVIFTQDVCEVCQIDTKCTQEAIHKLKKQPLLVPLTPQSLDEVFNTAVTIAKALGYEENAYRYLESLQKRIDYVIDQLRYHKALPKRVMVMEWIDPIYNCGHWIPHQVAYAGGIDMLGNPSGDSIVTQWDKIAKYNPEVLVIAPCGFHVARALQEMHLMTKRLGWNSLEAVRTNQVYIADFDLFTQPSPGTLTDGIELLASLFHPNIFAMPDRLKSKAKSFQTQILV
jgi:iron complex transport system substrate-binding protein